MQYVLFMAVLFALAAMAFAADGQPSARYKTAIFGGGCFWCMEPPFEQLAGVIEVTAGYCGGDEINPTYGEVSAGRTSHLESVRVVYDPEKISYRQLLDTYWRHVDPTDPGGQFADRGNHYKTAIFYSDEEEKQIAEQSRDELAASGVFGRPIVTAVRPVQPFYPAEEYHQDYYKKNVARYQAYKVGSGRAGFLEKTWQGRPEKPTGNIPTDQDLRVRLTTIQ